MKDKQLSNWIDIHSHLLPDVDNGAVSMKQTIEMLENFNREGITGIIATPHYGVGCLNSDKGKLEKKLELVRKEADKINKNFRIELGNELYYSEDIIEDLRKEKALTLAGTRYVLVKFSKTEEYRNIKAGLHRLLIYGFLPILTYIEVYENLYQNYEGIYDMVSLGAYMQMNVTSIAGGITNKKAIFCKKLLDNELVQILGTDDYSIYQKSPGIKNGMTLIRKKYGDAVLNKLFTENAQKLLKNQYI